MTEHDATPADTFASVQLVAGENEPASFEENLTLPVGQKVRSALLAPHPLRAAFTFPPGEGTGHLSVRFRALRLRVNHQIIIASSKCSCHQRPRSEPSPGIAGRDAWKLARALLG